MPTKKNRTLLSAAAALQASAAYCFIAGGADHKEMMLVVGAISSVAGLIAWGIGWAGSPETRSPTPVAPAHELDGHDGQLLDAIRALQDDVAQLREERAFLGELYSPGRTAPEALGSAPPHTR